MKILVLPGNAKINEEWLNLIVKSLSKITEKTEIIEYSHWKENKNLIDIDKELEKINGVYDIVIAKSAGVILALRGIKEFKIISKKCVFIGTPIKWAEKNGFQPLKYFDNYKTPTLFIQNKEDPTCSSNELKAILKSKNIKNYEIIETRGTLHDYDFVDKITEETIRFSQKDTGSY